MTRFKKGSKVEVFERREVPSGSWRSAQIISGNGHTYYVQYDGCLPVIGETVERVPRKALRPCPPAVKSRRTCVPGDIIEVFENGSWKTAQISRIVGGGYFFVRLVGSSRQLRVHESDIRLRQSLKGNRWIVVEQGCGNCIDEKTTGPLEGRSQPHVAFNQYAQARDDCFKEPTRGCWKRRRETHNEGGRRKKAARQEHYEQEVAVLSTQLLPKVDAVVSPQIMMGEKYMHASFNRTGFSELDTWRADEEDLSLYHDCAESISSSVGSCSTSGSPYRLTHYPITKYSSEDMNIYSNDAQSCSGSGQEPSLGRSGASAKDIHDLEVHAYRTTMAALYASGPMSWEQEALLTNLRLTLHISNDEHLWEIKHLVSSETRTLR